MNRGNRTPSRDRIPFNYAKETHSDDKKWKKDGKTKYDTYSETSKQAFSMAKWINGIPNSQEPNKQKRIDDTSNTGQYCMEYQFTNEDGKIIVIRKDNPTTYENVAGNQKGHYNAGVKDGKLDQHHYFDRDN